MKLLRLRIISDATDTNLLINPEDISCVFRNKCIDAGNGVTREVTQINMRNGDKHWVGEDLEEVENILRVHGGIEFKRRK